jgi:polysaccharide export outer membrane protein
VKKTMTTRRPFVHLSLLAAVLAACAASPPAPGELAADSPSGSTAVQTTPYPSSDRDRLRQLAAERSAEKPADTYLVGPGDLLEVNVFDLAEMNRKVRVSTSGYIQLPLIGAVRAAGTSEADLAAVIARRLAASYLQNPQVDVFVEEYKSQQVAVTGSVAKPGLYPLTRERSTILDMISEAGGLTDKAGGLIQLIPSRSGEKSAAFDVASAGGVIPLSANPDDSNPLAAEAISIDLNDLLRSGASRTINVAVAPGDVVFVPEAGEFTIEGWIDKPGTYPLTRNTTVLAAVSAGGGPLFPARLGRVQLLRTARDSAVAREVKEIDVNAVRSGAAPDVTLRSGDVVRVPAWAALLPPWAFYAVLRDLIRIGASVPVI